MEGVGLPPPAAPDEVRRAVANIPSGRAIGLCGCAAFDIRMLPGQAWVELDKWVDAVEARGQWLATLAERLLALLARPTGGEEPSHLRT